MHPTTQHCIVTTTCAGENEARQLTQIILEKKLAACVQESAIHSSYCWQGKINHGPERLLTIKTRIALVEKLAQTIRENHSYDVPQILQLPIQAGAETYLNWIDEVTAS